MIEAMVKSLKSHRADILCALVIVLAAATAGLAYFALNPDISNDGTTYIRMIELAQGGTLQTHVPPLYLYFVRLSVAIFHSNIIYTGIYLNIFFFSLTAGLCFLIGRIMTGRIEPGVWCGVLLIFQQHALSFACDFLREGMYLFMVAAFLLTFTCAVMYASLWWWWAVGVFNVLAFFTRYEGAELVLLVPVGWFISWWLFKQSVKKVALSFLAFVIGCVCTLVLLWVLNVSFEFIVIMKPHMVSHGVIGTK